MVLFSLSKFAVATKIQFQKKMKIDTSLSLLVYAVFVKSLSNSQRLLVDLFVNDVSCYVNCLSKLVTELYVEKKSFLYSTGKDNFDKFASSLRDNLKILDYKARINEHVATVQPGYVRNKLSLHTDQICVLLENHIHELLEETLIRNVRSETEHITKCLQEDSFFNLSRTTIPVKTIKYMKKGGKYNPYTKKENLENIKRFNNEFARIMKYNFDFSVNKFNLNAL